MEETKAKDIMSKDVLKGRKDMTMEEALKLLVNNRITGFPVVDEGERFVGIYSEYDLIVQLNQDKGPANKVFESKIQFSPSPCFVKEDLPLKDILKQFVDTKFRRLAVVDPDGRLVGLITRRDIMRLYYYREIL